MIWMFYMLVKTQINYGWRENKLQSFFFLHRHFLKKHIVDRKNVKPWFYLFIYFCLRLSNRQNLTTALDYSEHFGSTVAWVAPLSKLCLFVCLLVCCLIPAGARYPYVPLLNHIWAPLELPGDQRRHAVWRVQSEELARTGMTTGCCLVYESRWLVVMGFRQETEGGKC